MPRLEQIFVVRPGHDEPEKTSVPLMSAIARPRVRHLVLVAKEKKANTHAGCSRGRSGNMCIEENWRNCRFKLGKGREDYSEERKRESFRARVLRK